MQAQPLWHLERPTDSQLSAIQQVLRNYGHHLSRAMCAEIQLICDTGSKRDASMMVSLLEEWRKQIRQYIKDMKRPITNREARAFLASVTVQVWVADRCMWTDGTTRNADGEILEYPRTPYFN